MKIVAPVLILVAVLIQLTGPNGISIYFSKEEIVAISPPDVCDKRAGSAVMTTMGSWCIKETVPEVVDKYNAAK